MLHFWFSQAASLTARKRWQKSLSVQLHKVTVLRDQWRVTFLSFFSVLYLYSHFPHSLFCVSIITDSLKGEETLTQLKTVQGTERHTVALSWSHFRTIIYPFLCEQVTYNHFVSFLKNPQQGTASYKVCIKQIYHRARWLAETGTSVQ